MYNNHLKRSQSALRIFNHHLCNYTKLFYSTVKLSNNHELGSNEYDSQPKETRRKKLFKKTIIV